MEVFLSELAEFRLLEITSYLKRKWNEKVKKEFLKKLDTKINQISLHPESCPESSDFRGLFKCVVTKQITFYYRVKYEDSEIEIITFFDTRQGFSKLNKEFSSS